jgi:hypothetical protein
MTAFVKKGTREEVGVITDFVDPKYAIINEAAVGDSLTPRQCRQVCPAAHRRLLGYSLRGDEMRLRMQRSVSTPIVRPLLILPAFRICLTPED